MSNIKLFQDKKIRSVWDEEKEQWYFSVVDVVAALTDSSDPKQYIKKMRARDPQLNANWGTICTPVQMTALDGKSRRIMASDIKGLFRLIQSIPSPKAEPFKLWLSQVGYERVLEIENPELAQERMKVLYEQKGYPKDWIDKRIRGIAIRQNLTDEWKKRGITEEKDYAILTAEISKANMTDLELIFTMLGERVTTEISEKEKPDTFSKSKSIAKRGGNVAGIAREQTEKELGRSIISSGNYLNSGDEADTEPENQLFDKH